MKFKQRLHQFGIAFDQQINTLVGLFHARGAWADETISARAWREGQTSKKWLFLRRVIDGIFFWQEDHCQTAYATEQARLHMAPEYRPTDDA